MALEMELSEIRIDETSHEQVIVMKEKAGVRLLPIVIGMFEAQSIHVKINEIKLPRPLTHDLFLGIRENTFYARLWLETSSGEVDVDARPSDAIALAIRAEAPIFCEEHVLDQLSSGQ